MIIILNQNDFSDYPDLLEQMYRSMASRLQKMPWETARIADDPGPSTIDGCMALYVLSVSDDQKTLHSSCRLLPTSGSHMMSNVFGPHFEPDAMLRTPLIWEITQFCRSTASCDKGTPCGLYFPTIELLAGVCEVGMRHGMSHASTVFEPLTGRMFRRAGLRLSIIGRTTSLGTGPMLAGLWELDRATLAALRRSGGFHKSVLKAASSRRPKRRSGQVA
jgi:N-acyl-L-homoserine lactone synthetase